MEKLYKKNKSRGYALYTAIILTGVLILVAYITANIASKELLFSTAQADSHVAFYNADSGLECALYWDLKSGSQSSFDIATTAGKVICNNQPTITTGSQTVNTNPTQSSVIGGSANSVFELDFTSGCAIVSVTKNLDNTTQIKSFGYNSCSSSSSRRLERGVTIVY